MAALTTLLRRYERVGIDTSVFIYHFEGRSRFADLAAEAMGAVERGICEGLASTITLMELAVGPLRLGRPDVADEYEVLLANYPNLTLIGIERRGARLAAELRAAHGLRPADALQLGACIDHGATAFVTNDRALRRVDVVDVLLLEDFAGV